MGNGMVRAALGDLDARLDHWKGTLVELCRIPSVSAAGFPPDEVRRSAQAVAQALRDAGVENVEVLEIPGVHPYVYGDWLHRPGAPTVLLYGHHDVMPPGRAEKWLSPAFEPAERAGRLYGRGTADDKGGVMAHVAAVGSYLRAAKTLPLNVKFIVEGEEEIGSRNLGRFLQQYRAKMAADFIVLTDTAELRRRPSRPHVSAARHLPGRRRGAGPAPAAPQRLQRARARPRADSLRDDRRPPDEGRRAQRAGPLSATSRGRARSSSRASASCRCPRPSSRRTPACSPGVRLWGEGKYSLLERMWTRPALTVIALEARPFLGSSNQIIEAARARLSLRTVPGMDAREAGRLIVKKLTTRPPFGVKVTATVTGTTPWWTTDPEGPAFEAARAALKAGFGKDTAMVGAGGTIGFVQPFADLLEGAPCILMGVADPNTQAHSENESLHLGDWVKAMRSTIHLYDGLARVPRR